MPALLSIWCPVYRGRDSNPGSCTELENLVGYMKEKGASGEPVRPIMPKLRYFGLSAAMVVLVQSSSVESVPDRIRQHWHDLVYVPVRLDCRDSRHS
jgi:hypothetical protein